MANNEAKVVFTGEDRLSRVIGNLRNELVGMQGAATRLGSVLGPLGGFAAGAAAFTAVTAAIKQFVGQIDDLADTAEGLGVTAVALAELRSKAAEAGVGATELDNGLAKLNKRLADAKGGSEDAAAAFKAVGIDPKQVRGTEEALGLIADRFKTYANTAEKGALASEFFGEKAGRKFVAYLSQGSEELRQFTGITTTTISEAQKLQGEIDKLSTSFDRLKNSLLGGAVPAVNKLVEGFGRFDLDAILEPIKNYAIFGIGTALNELQRQAKQIGKDLQMEEIVRAAKELEDMFYGGAGGGTRAPVVPSRVTPKKEEIEESRRALAQYIEQLERQQRSLTQITETEQALVFLKSLGPLGDVEQVRQLVLEEARLTDELKRQKDLITDLEKGEQQERASALRAETDEWRAMATALERVKELTGQVTINLQRQFDVFQKMLDKGLIDEEQFGLLVLDVLPEVAGRIEKTTDLAKELGLTFASAFEDAIVGGKGLSAVLKGLGDDILRIFTRKLITEPLANFIGTLLPAGGGLALGGAAMAGVPYLVGERGPELFVPNQSGTVVPNGKYGNGVTVVQYNTYGSGVSRAELAPLLEMNRQATVAQINAMAARNSPRLAV